MTNEELIIEIRNGNEEAREQLVKQNQEFIFELAHRYKNVGEFDDLVSLGNIGLIKAIDSFDESKGLKFITYFSRFSINEILMYFRKIKRHRKLKVISVDETMHEDGEGNEASLLGKLKDETAQEKFTTLETGDFTRHVMKLFIENESEKMIKVLNMSIIKNMKQREIAETLGVGQPQTCRLVKKVKERLKYYGEMLQENRVTT